MRGPLAMQAEHSGPYFSLSVAAVTFQPDDYTVQQIFGTTNYQGLPRRGIGTADGHVSINISLDNKRLLQFVQNFCLTFLCKLYFQTSIFLYILIQYKTKKIIQI